MTKEQFDKYSFSSNTEVYFDEEWWKLDSIDFEERVVCLSEHRTCISFKAIQDIRN